MMTSTRTFLFAAVLAAALPAACDSSRSGAPTPAASAARDERRAVILSYSAPRLLGNQHIIHQSLERYAKEKGWQVITTTSGGDPGKQVEQIKNFIALRVNAIVAVPDDSKGICEAAAAAKAANIPFYTIDRAPEGCKINMVVLSDNAMAGRQAAESMVSLLRQRHGEPRGKVLEITGDLATNVAKLRSSGFQEVMRRSPDVTLVTRDGQWDTVKGEAIVREALAATPDLDGIYMHADAVYLPGTLKVMRELGRLFKRGEPRHIFTTAVDADPVGIQALKDGYADQSSNQPIPDFGLIVDFIDQEMKGKPIAEGEVKRDGALWSPARIVMSEIGPQLILSTTSVTEKNMTSPDLWANQ